MNVNFFVTCIGDALKSRMARDSVLLLEKLGCRVNFPEKQGCCGQPAINSGYIKEAIPGMKNLIAALEDNDDPIISPAGSCTYAVKSYPTYLADEPEWASRAAKVAARMQDLTSFIVNKLGVPGTYVRPHRHPHTFELLLPLRGRFVVLNFDDRGTVTHRAILGETCTVLEMAAGTWHAVLSLDTGGIIFEVKHGGYQPVAADDYAHWAPAEGEPGTTELMAWYAQAQVGDSTFAV